MNIWLELATPLSFDFMPSAEGRRDQKAKIGSDNRNGNPASEKPCCVKGCENPRAISKNGNISQRCIECGRIASKKAWAKWAAKRKLNNGGI